MYRTNSGDPGGRGGQGVLTPPPPLSGIYNVLVNAAHT